MSIAGDNKTITISQTGTYFINCCGIQLGNMPNLKYFYISPIPGSSTNILLSAVGAVSKTSDGSDGTQVTAYFDSNSGLYYSVYTIQFAIVVTSAPTTFTINVSIITTYSTTISFDVPSPALANLTPVSTSITITKIS